MADLELEKFNLELMGTDVIFAMPHADGTNTVQALDPSITMASVARHSGKNGACSGASWNSA